MGLASLTAYQQTIFGLSERIVAAQKPIRILNAIKWPVEVQAQFFAQKCQVPPQVSSSTYEVNPLYFDPVQKVEELLAIERDICSQLGQEGVAAIMLRMCGEYRTVIRLIQARGTAEFSKISRQLYGSAQDPFYAGAPTLQDLAKLISGTLALSSKPDDPLDHKLYNSDQALCALSSRLQQYFADSLQPVHVRLSDDIVADAAAGAEYIKLRREAMFSERDIRILEVHEGWVHVGTTLNGLAQPVCTFLSKGPPSSTINQEGLAIIMEVFTFSSYPQRVKRLTCRVTAIDMVEQGAEFLDVFRFYQEQGFTEEDSYNAAVRVFRGCVANQGPFTKDLSYSKGFILIYNYMRLAIKNGFSAHIPLLFLGKTTLEDLPVLYDLMQEGTVTPPKYLPPQFRDLAALTAWMTYSLFLNKLNVDHLAVDHKGAGH